MRGRITAVVVATITLTLALTTPLALTRSIVSLATAITTPLLRVLLLSRAVACRRCRRSRSGCSGSDRRFWNGRGGFHRTRCSRSRHRWQIGFRLFIKHDAGLRFEVMFHRRIREMVRMGVIRIEERFVDDGFRFVVEVDVREIIRQCVDRSAVRSDSRSRVSDARSSGAHG